MNRFKEYKVVRCPHCKIAFITIANRYKHCPACGRYIGITRFNVLNSFDTLKQAQLFLNLIRSKEVNG